MAQSAWLQDRLSEGRTARQDPTFSIRHPQSWQASEFPTPLPACSSKPSCATKEGVQRWTWGPTWLILPSRCFQFPLKWEDFFCFCFRLPQVHCDCLMWWDHNGGAFTLLTLTTRLVTVMLTLQCQESTLLMCTIQSSNCVHCWIGKVEGENTL